MNIRAFQWIGASGLWCLALAVLAGACGGAAGNTPWLGSESHFLERCQGSCSGGLDCIGGICTRACLIASSSCTELAPSASCTDQSVEPGAVAVCDVACSARSECSALGDGYSCDGAFCRASAAAVSPSSTPQAEPSAPTCDGYEDQTPPPDVRGFSITNRSSQVLYLQPSIACGSLYSPSLVRVARDGRAVNTLGGGCARSCQETLSSGWTLPGEEGPTSGDCPGLDCVGVPRVAIQPGETLFDPAHLEVVFRALPQGCAQGISTATVNCYSNVIPPRGNYILELVAYTEPECVGGSCLPAVTVSQPSEWYFENQNIDITLPL